MTIDEVISDRMKLNKNFETILTIIETKKTPSENLIKSVSSLPTTHTFGFENVYTIDKELNITETEYPYINILFEDKAIIANQLRKKIFYDEKSIKGRNMSEARSYGLDKYVFSYLGIHEYYYAQHKGSNIAAFGVFISPSTDDINKTNATLYDLKSKYAKKYSPEELTLTANDARTITTYEIENKYSNDFFRYWICENYESKKYHDDQMWEHKREFHFYEKVDLHHISTVIWPIEYVFDINVKKLVPRNGIMEQINDFKRSNKNITVFLYKWNEEEGKSRFSYASALVIKYLFNKNRLPSNSEFDNEFETYFND